MAATFPGGVKVFTTKQAGDQIASAHINDLQAEVVAVETELRKTTGSVVDHGGLAGLADNDHPQYRIANSLKMASVGAMADDTASSITPTNAQGILFLRTLGGDVMAAVFYDAISPTAYCSLLTGTTTVEIRTGDLSGTTGTDGKFIISAHTNGKIYLENRRGATLYPGYIAL